MSIRTWLRTPRVRRTLAGSAIVLAAGGLVLARTPVEARPPTGAVAFVANGSNSVSFSGPGAHGAIALSHTRVLAGGGRRVVAEVDVYADASAEARERAPIPMAVVLDTSGSMAGEKLDQAKTSVIQLIRDMRDDDEIALVRYSSDAELIQPLARAG